MKFYWNAGELFVSDLQANLYTRIKFVSVFYCIDLDQNPPIIDDELSFLESTLKVSPAFRIMLI